MYILSTQSAHCIKYSLFINVQILLLQEILISYICLVTKQNYISQLRFVCLCDIWSTHITHVYIKH